jgi:hypothetical protein
MRFRSTPPPADDDADDVDNLSLYDDPDEEKPAPKPAPPGRQSSPAPAAVSAGQMDPAGITAPAGTLEGMTALHRRAFKTLTLLFGITAVLVMVVTIRLGQRGQWLPEMPDDIGAWSAADMPLAPSALQILGSPPSRGRRYSNLYGEKVEAHVISTATFEAYTEPKNVMAGYGYALTAEKRIPLFDKYGGVRALILRSDAENGARLLMYYWIQSNDGMTTTRGSLRNYTDILPRMRLGVNAVVDPKQSVIVRVYTNIHNADTLGLQARRNMNEIARAIHQELMKQGTGKTDTRIPAGKGDSR